MKLLRTLAAPAAIAIALGMGATGAIAPVANAADVTPQVIAGDTPLADVQPLNTPINNDSPEWRKIANRAENRNRVEQLNIYSPAMDRWIPTATIPATNEAGERLQGAPTLYLLNGAGGAEQDNDWITLADTINFYSGKGVNVVIPMAGAFSYYLDWAGTPNGTYLQGPQKWETFLTKELPGPIESHLGADNRRGVIGFSMSATSSLLFAAHNPRFYDAAAGFSGCYATSTPVTYAFTGITVNRGGSDAQTMLGPLGSPHNIYNDALVHAEGLRGTDLYISNATGLASRTDQAGYYIGQGADPVVASANAAVLQIEGGVIEAATNACTHDMKAKLDSLDIPADYKLRNTGTHSWPSWRTDLVESWPTFQRAFGM